jgi:2,5-diamino-6-(ribosylamino)-4(3H)-pyrimidinone 5'-phosphate reductase
MTQRTHTRPRPYVSINMAMTADGKIATANRRESSFGSPRDQRRLYALRALADAVMCGARTVNGANVDLNSGGPAFQRRRLRQGLSRENLRVVVSASARIRPSARLLHERGGPVILLTTRRAPGDRVRRLESQGVHVGRFGETEVDLPAALAWLRSRWGVRHLHVEGGGTLNASLLSRGLVDTLHLTICPLILGGRRAPTIADGAGGGRLSEARPWGRPELRQVGEELFLTLHRTRRRPPARRAARGLRRARPGT